MAAMVSMLALGSFQEGETVVTYEAIPRPTGTLSGAPALMTPGTDFRIEASDVEDMDTKHTVSSSCSPSTTLVSDGSAGSYWTVFDPGAEDSVEIKKLKATYTTQSWNAESEGEGDYGSYAFTTATFHFDDGREDSDPRHDSAGLGGVTTMKIVPEKVTTALGSGPRCHGGMHVGHCFRHTVLNVDFPTFRFEGLKIREKVLGTICEQWDKESEDAIIASAHGEWTITGDNSFDLDDCHTTGEDLAPLLAKNPGGVALFQVYCLESWGWPAKNPDHYIGKGGSFLSGIHLVMFRDESNTFCRVTKDGVTCACTESTCPGMS